MVRRRFWLEAGSSAASALLLFLTALVPGWIEAVFGIEPDGGNGSLEWALVFALAVCTAASTTAARAEWRDRRGTRAA